MNAETYSREALLRLVPRPVTVMMAETTALVRRNKGGLLFLALLLVYFGLTPFIVPRMEGKLFLFMAGRPGFFGSLFFSLFGIFWGIAVWSDFPPGRRGPLLVLPLGRLGRLGYRCLAGALIVVGITVCSLLVSGLVSDLIAPGTSLFSAAYEFRFVGFVWTLLAVLNAYLLGTLLAMWDRRPDLWSIGILFIALIIALLAYSFDVVPLQLLVKPLYQLVGMGTGIWVTGLDPLQVPDPPRLPIVVLGVLLSFGVVVSMVRLRE